MKKITQAMIIALFLFTFGGGIALAQGGQTHTVRAGETLTSIAAKFMVSPTALMAANNITNPDLVYAGQKLVIPSSGGVAMGGMDEMGQGYYDTYTVQLGDTLNSIAYQYGVSSQALAMANGLSNADKIYAGQVLKVPGMGGGSMPDYGPKPSQPIYTPPVEVKCGAYYTVKLGDTLTAISVRYVISIEALSQANMLSDSDIIYEGQKLCIPGIPPSPSKPEMPDMGRPVPYTAETTEYYIVKQGDTVAAIAKQYNIARAIIIKANNLPSGGTIYVGQRLVIVRQNPGGNMTPSRKMKSNAPPPPKYVKYEDSQVSTYRCFSPADKWSGSQVTVKAVDTWCAMMDFIDDPDGLSSIAVRTIDKGGAGVTISQNGEAIKKVVTDNSGWLYLPVAPGTYAVTINDDEAPAEVVGFTVEAGKRAWLEYRLKSVSENPRLRNTRGWSGYVARNDGGVVPAQGVSSVLIVRAGARGLTILLYSEGSNSPFTCYTGTKIEHGADACEFGGLWPGKYTVTLDGADVSVEVFVDGVATAEVIFDPKATQ